MRRIVLCGYRGTGKTEVGKILAAELGLPFLDTDALIEEKTGRSIPDIFHEDGEERFRKIEREVVAGLPPDGAVVSTGGGAVVDPDNMEHLRKESTLILLHADLDTITDRISRSPRPPLTNLPLREEIAEMMDRRRQNYHAAADLCIDTGGTTPRDAAEKILHALRAGTATPAARKSALAFFRSGRIPAPNLKRLEEILGETENEPLTRVLGIVGYPCAHSRGPKLFNELFARYGIACHYTWFEDPDIKKILTVAKEIGARGLSVTIPFKQEIIPLLDEIDEHAAGPIGAVNTVVFACGAATGYNTDWLGIRKPLVHLKGARAVLLGAGGVAAAAAHALVDLEMNVTILNRTPEKAKILAERAGCRWASWETFDLLRPDLVVNATPLGMEPDTRNPLQPGQLDKEMTVFDLVYTPPVTPLIEAARAAGCPTITGTEMFIEQAKEQFWLWFGIDVPSETIRKVLA